MEFLLTSGHVTVSALVFTGFAVGIALLTLITNSPGEPTEDDFRVLGQMKKLSLIHI